MGSGRHLRRCPRCSCHLRCCSRCSRHLRRCSPGCCHLRRCSRGCCYLCCCSRGCYHLRCCRSRRQGRRPDHHQAQPRPRHLLSHLKTPFSTKIWDKNQISLIVFCFCVGHS